MRGIPEAGSDDAGALPNNRLQATADSLRSCLAAAIYGRRLTRGVAMTADVCAKKLRNGMGGNSHGFC